MGGPHHAVEARRIAGTCKPWICAGLPDGMIKLSVGAIGYKAKLFHLHGEELWESAESVLDHF